MFADKDQAGLTPSALAPDLRAGMGAGWRAATYPASGQICLYDNAFFVDAIDRRPRTGEARP